MHMLSMVRNSTLISARLRHHSLILFSTTGVIPVTRRAYMMSKQTRDREPTQAHRTYSRRRANSAASQRRPSNSSRRRRRSADIRRQQGNGVQKNRDLLTQEQSQGKRSATGSALQRTCCSRERRRRAPPARRARARSRVWGHSRTARTPSGFGVDGCGRGVMSTRPMTGQQQR